MLIGERHSKLPQGRTRVLWLLALAAGCGRVSADGHRDGGGGGSANGGAARGGVDEATAGGTSASGGVSTAGGGRGSVEAGTSAANGNQEEASGADGEGGERASASGGAAAAAEGGDGGACGDGFALCPDQVECTDLRQGNPQGDGVVNCGACGISCSLEHASHATCQGGTCDPFCDVGFRDCNRFRNDGCETSLNSLDNCDECGRPCSQTGAISRSCVSRRCLPTCAPRYADCHSGGVWDDGCETYLDRLDRCATNCIDGVACGPTEVCNDGSCGAPSGVAVLRVPATNVSQSQLFADQFIPPVRLEDTTLTVRAYAPGATSGTLTLFMTDTTPTPSPTPLSIDLVRLSQKWTDIDLPVSSDREFNAAHSVQVNLVVTPGPPGSSPDPTVLYVDSIRTSNLAIDHRFDSSPGYLVRSPDWEVPGSTLGWSQSVP